MAKPSALPMGRADPHVLQSRGADNYIMNFYVTNYSTSFTKPNIEFNKSRRSEIPVYSGGPAFKPRSAPESHSTGYTTNVRPQIYYKETLDRLDNPEMGRMCAENYNTITHVDYKPYELKDGNEELPAQVLDQTSAYTQNAYNHNPREAEVHSLYIDTKIRAPYDVLDKHRPILHKINNHDPIPNENYGHGQNYMSTEYVAKFDEKKAPLIDKNHSSIGPKETSGFVNNKEVEDALTSLPGERWNFKNRETGITVYKDKFLPYAFSKSETQLPNISNLPTTKGSTYQKAYRPSDINPRGTKIGNQTEHRENFVYRRSNEPSLAEKLGTAMVGAKEETGSTHCIKPFVQTLDDPRRFNTNYQMKHFDMSAKGKDREGHVIGGVHGPFDDGYTKNVTTHNHGILSTAGDLLAMDPYQSRSIRANDKFYAEKTHEHKFTVKNNRVTFQDNNPYAVKLTV